MKVLAWIAGSVGAPGVLFGFWWFFGHVAQAESDHTEQETLVEAVETLKEIHKRQDTVADAERKQLLKLCRSGAITDKALCLEVD